ncbi:MAG: fumarylacetoacetate hydrolase family protein [Alicyclobacillus herbarius]|uniref:2-keto-4-pentenoate hydratase n=1 Tax=Alicyclobacillus herbarius TaxID=122960 RepID=UPI002355E007|nr:fumarylacetoacetate hydrolase family protein [Alicyclobacillus herbarius]MCL6632546.1 fumarylacetoacetate hydrolase family protein [Alicyclobacillus herbarius]
MDLQAIAEEVWQHQEQAQELDKLTVRYPGLTVDDAYEIQRLNTDRALKAGDTLAGWKMGLTSRAKQVSVGVDEPIYGRLFGQKELFDEELSLTGLIHPRVEPELAFVFKHRLEGPRVTARDVWLATECVVPAVEVIDSRYRNFSFTLVDVVADNASFARFLLADQAYSPYHCAWDEIGVVLRQNGEVKQTGAGAAVLGHPVRAVVQLARMLAKVDQAIEPGMVVLTGGITEAIHLHAGDDVSVEFDGLGEIRLHIHE